MPASTDEVIAKCDLCGFHIAKPFPTFELADDPLCPQCGNGLAGNEPQQYSGEIDSYHLLRAGQRLLKCRRDSVPWILKEAFIQGLDSIDLRITFTNRYEDEAEIEILAIR